MRGRNVQNSEQQVRLEEWVPTCQRGWVIRASKNTGYFRILQAYKKTQKTKKTFESTFITEQIGQRRGSDSTKGLKETWGRDGRSESVALAKKMGDVVGTLFPYREIEQVSKYTENEGAWFLSSREERKGTEQRDGRLESPMSQWTVIAEMTISSWFRDKQTWVYIKCKYMCAHIYLLVLSMRGPRSKNISPIQLPSHTWADKLRTLKNVKIELRIWTGLPQI